MPYDITLERRQQYRETSLRAKERKAALMADAKSASAKVTRLPRLNPNDLMPLCPQGSLSGLSLFSGGGGLDLGFERAGVGHVASYEILDICGQTLGMNRPDWTVCAGEKDGDVTEVTWSPHRGVDIVHGGPPCQPFSVAGFQEGANDARNMWPAFIRCVMSVKPRAFVAENVPGMLDTKFSGFIEKFVIGPLKGQYHVSKFVLNAAEFGVPQGRRRVFFVGFRRRTDLNRFVPPVGTHALNGQLTIDGKAPPNLARWTLGLPDIGFDALAPTLRSGFTGPRNTTGVVNSKASLALWGKLQIWPNGVQATRELAAMYPPENGHLRLAVDDCAILQGFPEDWKFEGAVYQALGQIGNSVAPPVAYSVARAVVKALGAG